MCCMNTKVAKLNSIPYLYTADAQTFQCLAKEVVLLLLCDLNLK